MRDTPFILQEVEGDAERVGFHYDFLPEAKAMEDGTSGQLVTELDDGDLIIEGYAAVFEGVDRQGENFIDGSFQRGIKSFLSGQASLNWHHKHDYGIGKVLDLSEVEGKGLKMKARVDYQPESSPLRYIYNGIKKGTYNALSVGGIFTRKLTSAGWRISNTDLTEISVTPVPVHPGTNFAVVAGKALADLEIPSAPDVEGEIRGEDEAMLNAYIAELNSIFDRINKRGRSNDGTIAVD